MNLCWWWGKKRPENGAGFPETIYVGINEYGIEIGTTPRDAIRELGVHVVASYTLVGVAKYNQTIETHPIGS